MLTANEYLCLEDYAFKNSPESCSGNSSFTDCTDLPSDEDFLQQLSSDLDIPLLLNPGEDELSLLNSFFDKSPEEIMSEIALPSSPKFDDIAETFSEFPQFDASKAHIDLCSEVKVENSDSCSSSASNKSLSPVQSPEDGIKFFEIKDEVKVEPHSPGSVINVPVHTTDSNILISTIANIIPTTTLTKKVPIQPKVTTSTPKNKVVVLKNEFKRSASSTLGTNIATPPAKVVVLENLAAVPITSVSQIPTFNNSVVSSSSIPSMIVKTSNSMPVSIDPKILKRHQRKIKNRESACLSRKKKKDYLTSLENQVRELATENQQLKLENQQLKEKLMKHENNQVHKNPSNVKTSIVLCMFLFSVAFHLDYFRNPFFAKNQALIQAEPPKVLDHHSRNLLWASDDVVESNNGSSFSPFSMCPISVNQTESARLALELERWIGKPKELDKVPNVNITKLSMDSNKIKIVRKKKPKKYESAFVPSVFDRSSVGKKIAGDSNNELQVFAPTPEQLYSEFFEAINKQDDTFYVVSFSDHHMLLPALHHNKTRRPKMSLIMPSVLPNENITHPTLVPLMQIDCEVLNTRLIQVPYGTIPRHLRKHGNSTYQSTESVSKSNQPTSNYTKRAYKPYFIKQETVRPNDEEYNIR